MDLIINPHRSFIQTVKDLIMKTENKEEEGEKRPSWVNEILEALKPKQEQEQTEEVAEIPLPPAPVTEEEEEEQEQPPKKSLLQKGWDFLM